MNFLFWLVEDPPQFPIKGIIDCKKSKQNVFIYFLTSIYQKNLTDFFVVEDFS